MNLFSNSLFIRLQRLEVTLEDMDILLGATQETLTEYVKGQKAWDVWDELECGRMRLKSIDISPADTPGLSITYTVNKAGSAQDFVWNPAEPNESVLKLIQNLLQSGLSSSGLPSPNYNEVDPLGLCL